MLASQPAGLGLTPERGTNLVSEASVPADMREVVASSQRQAWAYTLIRYTDGSTVPGLVVGAPLDVPAIGPYELYQLFPLTVEESTLNLVRNDTVVAGLLLVAGLAGLAALVTVTLVQPVNATARAARRLAGGNLEVRMGVHGEDDLAKLALSFNEMADALESHIRALRDLSAIQQRFVADVSHELRTPMTTLRMATDMLYDKRDGLPADDARAVELMAAQLDRFEALLSDLLEISRSDAGALALDLADTDLVPLVGRVVDALAPLAADQGCDVEVIGPDSLVIPCDGHRVERILTNLLANALEHGQGHPVTIEVAPGDPGAAQSDPAAGDATVRVVDRGVGLEPDQFEAVFQRFWRADPARTRRSGGTGLGLAIARGDAQAHGGDITAWGSPGAGATFQLRLPAHTRRWGPERLQPGHEVPVAAGQPALLAAGHAAAEVTR
jgi:two-component system sensor histidine kinase MtrB